MIRAKIEDATRGDKSRTLHSRVSCVAGLWIGLSPVAGTFTYGSQRGLGLVTAQVYPVTDTPDPYNPSLYTTTVSYITKNCPYGDVLADGSTGPAGVYATQSYTPTERPLATAKTSLAGTCGQSTRSVFNNKQRKPHGLTGYGRGP